MLLTRHDLFRLICTVITQDALVNQLPSLRLCSGLSWLRCIRLCLGRLIWCSYFGHLTSGCAAAGIGLALPPQDATNSQRTDEQQREDQHDDAAPAAPWFVVLIVVVEFTIGLRIIARSPAAITAGKCVIERIVKPGTQVIARLGCGRFRCGPAKRCSRTIAVILKQIVVAVWRALITLCRRRRRARCRSGWRTITRLPTRSITSRRCRIWPRRRSISRSRRTVSRRLLSTWVARLLWPVSGL